MKYKKINNKEDLNDWKKLLSVEDVIRLDSDLDDYAWHSVIDNNQIVAVFQIINVINKYSKNLDIKFAPTTREEEHHIVKIIIFIYKSILKICQDSEINKIKIHTHDPLMQFIFTELSGMDENSNSIKNVKKYGKWVEIDLK